jgi:DNA-binding winged helix-turn-helix (wHTH) protein
MEPYWEFGRLKYYESSHRLERPDRVIRLRPQVHSLLLLLLKSDGEPLKQNFLSNEVFGVDAEKTPEDLHKLKYELIEALGDNLGDTKYIEKIPKVGYRLAERAVLIPSLPTEKLFREAAPSPPTEGLVAYYTFDGNAQDASGNGNHVKTCAGVRYAREGKRRVASLDGSSGYFLVRHNPLCDNPLLTLKEFTIISWVNFRALNGRRRIIEKGNSNGYWLFLHNDCPLLGFYDGERYINLLSSICLRPNAWHKLAAVFDGRSLGLFVDDKYDGPRNVPVGVTPMQNSEPLVIGWKYGGIRLDHLAGMIRDVRIYNRALTDSEIRNLYIADQLSRRTMDNSAPFSTSSLRPVGRASPNSA